MNLTRSFTLEEMLHSDYAAAHGIDNIPANLEEVTANLKALCENVLQGIRDYFNKPVTVSSGYRSPALNAAIGGQPTSQHLTGQAADIVIDGISNETIFSWVRESPLPFDQLIVEQKGELHQWIHISFDSAKDIQRRECLRSPDGKRYQVA